MNPFDFVNNINSSQKTDLMRDDPSLEEEYSPFIVNKALSYFLKQFCIPAK